MSPLKKTLFIAAILFATSSVAQTDSLGVHFWMLQDTLAVFDVWNETDTSHVVGSYTKQGDTIYFKELETFLLVHDGANGVNTKPDGRIVPSPETRPNTLSAKFSYLGNKHHLLHFDAFEYVFDDSLVLSYRGTDENDTLHYVSFHPDIHYSLEIKGPNITNTMVNTHFHYRVHSRKRNKSIGIILDHWIFHFNAYGSIRKFDFDIEELVEGSVKLGNHVYTVVFE